MQSSTLRSIASLVSAAFLLFQVGAASAATVEIEFDFATGSVLSLLGGTIVTPPDGSIDIGSGLVTMEATDSTTVVSGGAASLSDVVTSGTVTKDFPGNADINGPFSATQVGSLAGTVAPGLDGINFASDLQLNINAAIGCTGTGCASLGFPVNESGTFPFTIGFLEITDIDILGAAGISLDIPVEIDGVLGTLSLVGTEINRTFIPEPGTALLFGLGLAGLGASRRRALNR